LIVAMAVGLLGSCKPKEKCPAYGKYKAKSQPTARA
jgi:hypothetical protein